jgi:hypothetical protein
VKNGLLRDYVLVPGSDGEAVVVSEGEIDPSFGGINASMTLRRTSKMAQQSAQP